MNNLVEEKDFTPQQAELYELMSDISEDCYCAGWIHDNEFSLWRILQEMEEDSWSGVRRDSNHYGMGTVDEDKINRIRTLSEVTGGWIIWVDDDRVPDLPSSGWGAYWIPMVDWMQMLADRQPTIGMSASGF